MRLFLASVILLSAIAPATLAAPAPKDKTTGEKLLGTWKLVRGNQLPPNTVTFFVEFAKDGKMSLHTQPNDPNKQATVLAGTYKVDGDKIDYTLTTQQGTKRQEVLSIKKLTETDLVTTDPDGIKEEFERVKSDKQGKKD